MARRVASQRFFHGRWHVCVFVERFFSSHFSNKQRRALNIWENLSKFQSVNSDLRPFRAQACLSTDIYKIYKIYKINTTYQAAARRRRRPSPAPRRLGLTGARASGPGRAGQGRRRRLAAAWYVVYILYILYISVYILIYFGTTGFFVYWLRRFSSAANKNSKHITTYSKIYTSNTNFSLRGLFL